MLRKSALVSRYLLGLMFTVFGLNGVLLFMAGKGFLPMPPPPPVMETIMTGFMATGYLMTLVAWLELIAGVLLLSGFFINLAIVFLGPLMVNILLIHVFAERSGLPMAIFVNILYIILVAYRWDDFRALIKKK